MTTGVFMSEKRNAKVIRAVKISCFRNKINTGIHQYLYRIIHGRTYMWNFSSSVQLDRSRVSGSDQFSKFLMINL